MEWILYFWFLGWRLMQADDWRVRKVGFYLTSLVKLTVMRYIATAATIIMSPRFYD